MHATYPLLKVTDFPAIQRKQLHTLQLNLGYRCNQTCQHCHVNAGPNRTEMMDKITIDLALDVMEKQNIQTLDLTGGAPELNPYFTYLIRQARALGVRVIDRCNLTVLYEPGQENLAQFLADQGVEITASLPCYSAKNVDQQRGDGTFDKSISALQHLNHLGYGKCNTGLVLNLVYNPQGAVLPPHQATLESDYKRELFKSFGIEFNQLYVLANMPIQRFGSTLISKGTWAEYMALLKANYSAANLETVMCRNLVSVDWQGYLYDCDFNQMLNMPKSIPFVPEGAGFASEDCGMQCKAQNVDGSLTPSRLCNAAMRPQDRSQDSIFRYEGYISGKARAHLRDLLNQTINGDHIAIADHCYGCTAGQGSSCTGALKDEHPH